MTTQSKYTNAVYCLIFYIPNFQNDISFRLAMRSMKKIFDNFGDSGHVIHIEHALTIYIINGWLRLKFKNALEGNYESLLVR